MAAPLYSRGASLIVRLEGQRVAGLRAGPEWPACGPGQSGRLAGRARVAGLRAGPEWPACGPGQAPPEGRMYRMSSCWVTLRTPLPATLMRARRGG